MGQNCIWDFDKIFLKSHHVLKFQRFGPKTFCINKQKSLFLSYLIERNTKSNIIFDINTLLIQTLPTSLSVFFLSPPYSKPERRPLSAFTEIRIRSDPYESPSVGSLFIIHCWPRNFLQMLNCLQRLFHSYPGFLKVNISSGTLGLNCTLFPFNLTAPAAFLVKSTVHY